MHVYLNMSKQMTDVKLLLLHNNICNPLIMCKKWYQDRLKILSSKSVYKSIIFYI